MSTGPIKTGYLNKQGNSYKSWKRRYFVLSKTHLAYYKQPNDPTPLGVVELNASHVAAGGDKVNGFKVTTPGRTFFFQADNQSDMSEWVEAVKSISENLLMRNIDNSHMIENKTGTYQGYLYKKGNDVLKGWNKRWFHLKRDSLTYYKTKEQTVPLGVLPLLDCTVKATMMDNRYGFEVSTGARTYFMCADKEEEQKKWVSSIEAAIKSIKEAHNEAPAPSNNSQGSTSSSSLSSSLSSSSGSSGPPSPSVTPASSLITTGSPLSQHSGTFSVGSSSPNPLVASASLPSASPLASVAVLSSSTISAGSGPTSPSSNSRRDSLAALRESALSGSEAKLRSGTSSQQPLKKQTSAILMRHKSNSALKVKDPFNNNLRTIREGYLTKMGHNMLKDWKRRWCVLQVGSLYYYKNKDEAPAGQIKLVTCRVRENEKIRPNCIEFVCPNRNYFMYADSPEDAQSWLKDLNIACTSVMEQFLEVDKQPELVKKSKKTELECLVATGADLRVGTLAQVAQEKGFLHKKKLADSSTTAPSDSDADPNSKTPKRNYVILKDHHLFYYLSDIQAEGPVGVLNVKGSSIITSETDLNSFQVSTTLISTESGRKKSWLFTCDSPEDREKWLSALNSLSSASSLSSSDPDPSSTTTQHPSSPGSPTPNEILKEYISKPDNSMNFCAECGFPEARWASINLGIMLCIECSGSHRSLGVHISQVRSVDLDNWNMEAVTFMQSMGNNKSNAIWEHTLPENYKKPLPNDSISTKEKWIRQKYVEKLFADPSIISKQSTEKKTPSSTPNFSKEGFLTKCGFSVKSWKRRWFILKPADKTAILSYYKNRGDPTPAGQIVLLGSDVLLSTTRANAFEVTTPNRTFTCIADSLPEAETWVTRIKMALEYIKEQNSD